MYSFCNTNRDPKLFLHIELKLVRLRDCCMQNYLTSANMGTFVYTDQLYIFQKTKQRWLQLGENNRYYTSRNWGNVGS